jgi:hypothetical protein
VFLRKALITLGCVAAIGMAGAGTASASAQQTETAQKTETTVGAQTIMGTNYKTKAECNQWGRFWVTYTSPLSDGWVCNLNDKGLYTLRVF